MKPKTELEIFLLSQAGEGKQESRGSFTLAREEALKRIAQFQLPFKGAWAVKLMQAAVAGDAVNPIRVDLLASTVAFYFAQANFTLDDLEESFFNPEPSANRSLRHLLSGLWAVGLDLRWGFQVAFPGCETTLIWNGAELSRVPTEQKRNCMTITLAPLQQKSSLAWAAGMLTSADRNAEILLTLQQYCYACPVPLTVDARRVDALQRVVSQRRDPNSFLLKTAIAESSLPPFVIPPGTFTPPSGIAFATDPLRISGGGWGNISQELKERLPSSDQAGVAYALCVHMKTVKQGKKVIWAEDKGPSALLWILDGAVVNEEKLPGVPLHVSVRIFVSAEGLKTDLSTFRLVESEQRSARLNQARKDVAQALQSIKASDFNDLVQRGHKRHLLGGGLIVAVGIGTILVLSVPFYGVAAIAYGAWTMRSAGTTERGRITAVESASRALARQLNVIAD